MSEQKKPYEVNPAFTHEVFRWPEFQAFARRLGIPIDLRTTSITIRMGNYDELVEVDVRFQAVDEELLRLDEPAVKENKS